MAAASCAGTLVYVVRMFPIRLFKGEPSLPMLNVPTVRVGSSSTWSWSS